MILAVLLAVLPGARAQEDEDARAGLSRAMRTAIHFYEQGDDTQAMDRFMEILTNGEPSERSMANEYINLITHRMNGGAPAPAPQRPAPAAARGAPSAELAVVAEAVPAPVRRPAPRPEAVEEPAAPAPARASSSRAARGGEMTAADKAVMRKEIKARLRAAQERSLASLKAIPGVRVVMRENGDPAAIGIPSSLLFQSGIGFQRDAAKILNPLTMLTFALGSTQALILPEGTALGDAKVLDMRRTMGISSSLYQAGVAPPRVRVNLLNTQVEIPKALIDFKGVVIVFQYDQPMALSVEGAVGDELGPPISLGVYPQQLRPARNEGGIIEFSVSEPPAGLVSWKFQLLQPSADGGDPIPLQEVVGGGPVFHQIFWNGRQNYFGTPLPAGRYECVLSALDAKNRTRTLHKWIQVLPEDGGADKKLASGARPEKTPAPAADAPAAAPAKAPAAAPKENLFGEDDQPLVKGVKASVEIAAPKPVGKSARKPAPRAARAKKAPAPAKKKAAAAPAPAADAPAATPGRYELSFTKNTHKMTAAAEKALAKAAAEISSFPLESLRVVGHATADEEDGAALADRRAKMVAGLLINRYQVEPKKIQVSAAAGEGATVELILARND